MARQSSPRVPDANDFRRIAYLGREMTPLYTLPELADRLTAFGSFLDEHCDFMINHGLPPAPFDLCRWLYLKLGRLYDTRATSCPWPHTEIFRSCPRPNAPPFEWLRFVTATFAGGHNQVLRCEKCKYHEADFLKGMHPRDGYRIEEMRPRLFPIKRQILELTVSAVQQGLPTDLLSQCIRILSDTLTADELGFLLQSDRFYLERDVRGEQVYEDNPELIPGGLTDVLEVIGHIEKELSIGTLSATRAFLPDSRLNRAAEIPEDDVTAAAGFWADFDAQTRRALIAASDAVASHWEREVAFWTEYRRRVADSFSRDFRVDVPISILPRHLALIEPLVERYSGHLAALIEQGRPQDVPFDPRDKPVWNRNRNGGELYFRGVLARRVRVRKGDKTNIIPVLEKFAELDWPDRIDDPVNKGVEARNATRKSLNKGLTGMRFGVSEKSYYWKPDPDR